MSFYLGFSVLTLFEFLELLVDFVYLAIVKLSLRNKTQKKSQSQDIEDKASERPLAPAAVKIKLPSCLPQSKEANSLPPVEVTCRSEANTL